MLVGFIARRWRCSRGQRRNAAEELQQTLNHQWPALADKKRSRSAQSGKGIAGLPAILAAFNAVASSSVAAPNSQAAVVVVLVALLASCYPQFVSARAWQHEQSSQCEEKSPARLALSNRRRFRRTTTKLETACLRSGVRGQETGTRKVQPSPAPLQHPHQQQNRASDKAGTDITSDSAGRVH